MPWRKIKNIGITDAIRRIGVSPERLRYWEIKGVITPNYMTQGTKRLRRYSEEDINVARVIKHLIDREGYTLKGAAAKLNRPYEA